MSEEKKEYKYWDIITHLRTGKQYQYYNWWFGILDPEITKDNAEEYLLSAMRKNWKKIMKMLKIQSWD